MTNERIAEIKALCEAVDAGPWESPLGMGTKNIYSKHGVVAYTYDRKTAEFIAAARQIIPELMEALENKAAEVELWKTGADRERVKRLIEEDRAKIHHEDFMALAAKREALELELKDKERLLINASAQFSNLQLACENEISDIKRELEETTKDLQEERERRYRISYNLEAVLKERHDE